MPWILEPSWKLFFLSSRVFQSSKEHGPVSPSIPKGQIYPPGEIQTNVSGRVTALGTLINSLNEQI